MTARYRLLYCLSVAVLVWLVFVPDLAFAVVSMDEFQYGALPNCYRISNASVEVMVSRDFGPRILRFGFVGGENLFAERPDIVLQNESGGYKLWGGHRLWTAPEDRPFTYASDEEPVTMRERSSDAGTEYIFVSSVQPQTGLQKEMHVRLEQEGTRATVTHLIRNLGEDTRDVAAWALTVMSPGGTVIIPQPARQGRLTPARSMTLWDYTDLGDPRWSFGKMWIQLRAEDQLQGRQKIGLGNEAGWLGYLHGTTMFAKVFPWSGSWEQYPDFGSNCEVYSDGGFVELESLGPQQLLAPGAEIVHAEVWLLYRNVDAGDSEESLTEALKQHISDLERIALELNLKP